MLHLPISTIESQPVPFGESLIAEIFGIMYYYSDHTWNNCVTRWMGVPVFQSPLDLWILQEIIVETQPDVIIETGTAFGGTALYMACCFDGKVITIDSKADDIKVEFEHDRIEFLVGDSIAPEIIEKIKPLVEGMRTMVLLDSDHRTDYVRREIELYHKFVSQGCYMVVHDTLLGGHPIALEPDMNPYQAVQEFLEKHADFGVDKSREKFYATFSPSGWLRRM